MTKVTGDSALGLCFTVHIWNGSLDQTANIMTRSLPHSRVICHKHEYVQWLTMYFKLKSPSSFKGTTAWILRQSLVVSFQSSLLSNYWLRCQIIHLKPVLLLLNQLGQLQCGSRCVPIVNRLMKFNDVHHKMSSLCFNCYTKAEQTDYNTHRQKEYRCAIDQPDM